MASTEAQKAAARRWRANNPEKVRAIAAARVRPNKELYVSKLREKNLRKLYGIGEADVWAMHAAQGGLCKLCARPVRPFSGLKPDSAVVDHDHDSGAVRGLLCAPCNVGLGAFRDDPALLEAGTRYLRAHGK